MNILYFLVGCSLLMALMFLGAFFWALKNGQHDDVYTPGVRILFDDDLEVFEEKPAKAHQNDIKNEKTEHNHFSV
jgi:cbb3-type cytochrome oxidase maturation protein